LCIQPRHSNRHDLVESSLYLPAHG
jgi:hypothetical protein